jgi:acylphosphatase
MRERVHLIVRGRVQGVGFRFFVRDRARQLALTGWVRNRADGGVEIVAEGEHEQLQQLVASSNHGPTGARVRDVTVEWQEASGEFSNFTIR